LSDSITIRRRVQWIDTDAQGIWHYSVIVRWAEEAEVELLRRVGVLEETYGATPRVRAEFEFAGAVRFDDVVDIALSVEAMGETSITYLIEAKEGSRPIATGRIVAVFIDPESGQKRSWPDHIRRALSNT
jgi:acyl-CoA thioester hydrolase